MEILQGLEAGLLGLVLAGFVMHLLGWIGLLRFRFRQPRKLDLSKTPPGVTIVKPCFTNLDNEEVNFERFLNQDYPGSIQILFVVTHDTDPIVPVIRKLLKKYPQKDAELVISQTRKAYWRKIDALHDGHQKVKHEVVIWSDSDTVVHSDYITQMVAALQEPGVSLVTTPQYDRGANNFPTALKTLGNNGDVGTYVMIFDLFVRKKKAGFGQSLGFWLSDFNQIDKRWETLNNSWGDDLTLPSLFVNHGKRVVYRNIYCPVQYSNKTLHQMLDQQKRFALCQKEFIGKPLTLISLAAFPQIPATVLLLIHPSSPWAQSAFLGVIALRVFNSFLFEALILKSVRLTLRYFWTIPLWDLLHIYLVSSAMMQNQVQYHGKTYRFASNLQLQELPKVPGVSKS